MTDPVLSIRNSGYFGRGYALPTRKGSDGKPLKCPGVTTVISALDKGGVVQWAVDLTAAYAVAQAQELAERDEDWGFKRLRFFHSRKPNYDDPNVNLNNFHSGVLDDLANQGTIIHQAVEAFIKEDYFGYPEWTRWEQEEAFEKFLEWSEENVVEYVASEQTVFDPDNLYAGTGDVWAVLKDGNLWYIDIKSARNIHDSHVMQGAALTKAPLALMQSEEGTEYKGAKWVEVDAPKVDKVGVLQVRQRSVDDYGNEIPAFCKLHEIPGYEIEPAYQQFLGALQVRKAQAALREARNAQKKREKENELEYF